MLPKEQPRYWLKNIVFVFFLVFLSWRIVDFFLNTVPLLLTLEKPLPESGFMHLWPVFQLTGDLFFFGFLLRGRQKPGLFPLAFIWITSTLFLVECGFCSTRSGIFKAIPFLLGSLFIAWLFILIFQKMRIRGKIFLVCLFCASIPMLFLGLALYQQNEFLLEHALFPFAKEMMFFEAQRLDLILGKRFEQSLLKFLDLPAGSGPFPILSDSEYFQKASDTDLPLIGIQEKILKPGASGGNSEHCSKRDLEMGNIFQEEPGHLGFFMFEVKHPEQRLIFSAEIPRRLGSDVVGIVKLNFDFSIWAQKTLLGIPILSFNHLFAIFPSDPKTMAAIFKDFKSISDDGFPGENPWKSARPSSTLLSDGHYWERSLPVFPGATNLSPVSINQRGPKGLTIRDLNGREFFVDSWSLPRTRADVAFVIPLDKLKMIFHYKQLKSVLSCIVAVFFAVLLSVLYSERLSQPIDEITEAAKSIRDGNLETRIPAQTEQVEIMELAETLSLMAEKLTGRIEIANQQLLLEKRKFETLVESTWEGIFLLSVAGDIIYSNHSARQLLGIHAVSTSFLAAIREIGKDFQPDLPERLSTDIHEFKAIFCLPLGQKGNSKIVSLYLKSTHHDSGFIAVCRDITAEKEIDRMKNDFVSQVSHELRTPLTSIQAYTEMLIDGEGGDFSHQKDYLKIIFDESERLTRLINDLLDIARIESGRRVIKPVILDLNALTHNIVQVLSGQASQKNIYLGVAESNSPANIYGDEDLIKQAGMNILSNALKYTPPGGTVKISIERTGASNVAWKFSDTGIGLTAQDKDRLFTKFFRADSDFVRAAGGTGLGLTLVKHIVDLHQGEILVDSEYGKGTTFSIILKQTMTSA